MRHSFVTAASLTALCCAILGLASWSLVPGGATPETASSPSVTATIVSTERPRNPLTEPQPPVLHPPAPVSNLKIVSMTTTTATVSWDAHAEAAYFIVWIDGQAWLRTTKNIVVLPRKLVSTDVWFMVFNADDQGSETRVLSIPPAPAPTPAHSTSPKPKLHGP